MKKNLIIVAIAFALYAIATNICIKAISSSSVERSFTRRFGAHSYLLQEPSRFKQFKFDKKKCKNRKEKIKDKKIIA